MAIVSTEENIRFTMSTHMAGGQSLCNGSIYRKTSRAILDSITEINIHDSSDIKKVYEITNADLREIALAAIGDNLKVGDGSEIEIVLPDEAMLALGDRENRDMSVIGEMADVKIMGALPVEERERMVDEMILNDIKDIKQGLNRNDTEFLDSVLRGDSGWTQYSKLSDDEVRSEYSELKARQSKDNHFNDELEDAEISVTFKP